MAAFLLPSADSKCFVMLWIALLSIAQLLQSLGVSRNGSIPSCRSRRGSNAPQKLEKSVCLGRFIETSSAPFGCSQLLLFAHHGGPFVTTGRRGGSDISRSQHGTFMLQPPCFRTFKTGSTLTLSISLNMASFAVIRSRLVTLMSSCKSICSFPSALQTDCKTMVVHSWKLLWPILSKRIFL